MKSKVVLNRQSPVSVADGRVDNSPGISPQKDIYDKKELLEDDDNDNENALELSGLTERDVIEGLKDLFREKNGREVTAEEVAQWLEAIRGVDDGVGSSSAMAV